MAAPGVAVPLNWTTWMLVIRSWRPLSLVAARLAATTGLIVVDAPRFCRASWRSAGLMIPARLVS